VRFGECVSALTYDEPFAIPFFGFIIFQTSIKNQKQ
jgi:hypothetical protein